MTKNMLPPAPIPSFQVRGTVRLAVEDVPEAVDDDQIRAFGTTDAAATDRWLATIVQAPAWRGGGQRV